MRTATGWPPRPAGRPDLGLLTDELGAAFASFEDYCRHQRPYGLGIDCAMLDAIIVERRRTGRERQQDAAAATTGAVATEGRPARANDETAQITQLPQTGRAADAGISRRQQQKLDALARRAPMLLQRVQAGELSVHRACVQAGIVKPTTTVRTDDVRVADRRTVRRDRVGRGHPAQGPDGV